MADEAARAKIEAAAKQQLTDASRFLFFDESGTVLGASFPVTAAELKPLAATLGDRDEAIRKGMVVAGTRYEVHRHHPPLVYGRTMGGVPETSEGCAICKVDRGITGQPCYGLITYCMPNVSARMVPTLSSFCKEHLTSAEQ